MSAFSVDSVQKRPHLGEMLHPFFFFFGIFSCNTLVKGLQAAAAQITLCFLVIALPDSVVSICIYSVHDGWLDLCCTLQSRGINVFK